jgi:hypothetical protein
MVFYEVQRDRSGHQYRTGKKVIKNGTIYLIKLIRRKHSVI